MAAKTMPYWMFPRPHRKLIHVPKSLSAFAGASAGLDWYGNKDAQIRFETQLESMRLKSRGNHTERDRGRGGSGGRTHAVLLYSLGLFFYHRETPEANQELHLTTAGQALVDQQDALPVLRKQVLAHQFPSAYSFTRNVNVDRKFKVRPFVALLKLLRHPHLDGYFTDREIAACVIGYMTGHSDHQTEKAVQRILAFRNFGTASLPTDFTTALKSPKGQRAPTPEELIKDSSSTLGAIANTAAQWIRYTGYAMAADGEDFDAEAQTVTALNPSLTEEIDKALEEWDKPVQSIWEPDDKFRLEKSAEAFQRTYGVKVGKQKDQRTIGNLRRTSNVDRTLGYVSAALTDVFATQIVTQATDDVVDAVVSRTGLDQDSVTGALSKLITTPAAGVNSFLDRYEQMAFAGQEEAIAFEKATAEVLERVFGLEARHIGQGGAVADVETWSDDWAGIIDTKAYATYDLPHDHQLRMQAKYVPSYAGALEGKPLKFFMYISGGFASGFSAKLRSVAATAGISGSGIAIQPWRHLIGSYPDSDLTHDDLLQLWTLNREITAQDVKDLVKA